MVPDALDCGYGGFRVWIEEPDGQRRFLRSPRYYCSPRGSLGISSDRPFRRDISIFGESGGYTFRKAGVHRIHVTFALDDRRTIQSNPIELEILRQAPDNPLYVDARACLSMDQIARLLYYRRMTPTRAGRLAKIADFCRQHNRHLASAFAHYGVGSALARSAHERHARGRPVAEVVRAARTHLAAGARRQQLGEHRRQKAEDALAALSALR